MSEGFSEVIRQRLDPKLVMNRPARQQATTDAVKPQYFSEGAIYNIWYNRYQGGSEFRRDFEMTRAETRCVLLRDAGRTMARPKSYICLYFARGNCSRGSTCQFWHTTPTEETAEKAFDCFGRERDRNEREDMGGVGSFEKENKTLFVGNIAIKDNIKAVIAKHFSEWGDIEHVKILEGRGIAFVRYSLRACAEFAKEAMYAQSMDDGEILNVKWASDDVSDKIKQVVHRQNEEKVLEAITKKLPKIGEKGTILDYQNPYSDESTSTKRRKIEQPTTVYYDNSAFAYTEATSEATTNIATSGAVPNALTALACYGSDEE